eukprot:745441_1
MATDDSVTIYTGAMAPSQVLTGYTGSTSVAYLPEPFATQNPGYNVYWYNYPKRSFGFAPTSSISIYSTNSIDRADRVSTNGDARLSWRVVGYGYIGGRAGTFWISNSNSIWHKAIYYKYCPPTTSPTPAPTELPTHYPSNDPTNLTRHPTISPSNYPSAPPTVSPTMSPTIPPTTAPTNAPSASPSHAPTFSPYEMIVIQDSYICADLAGSADVIYNITLAECMHSYCFNDASCLMVNYITNSKTSSDARCYIFDSQCNIYNDNQANNVIAFRGFQSFCVDYPFDWVDKYVDTCYHYELLRWCTDQAINTDQNITVNDIVTNTDYVYQFNANQVCCMCGGGVEQIDDSVLVSFESSVQNNPISTFDNRLCEWKHDKTQKWKSYDNLNLFDLCIKLKNKIYNNYIFLEDKQLYLDHLDDINCDFVFDKSYSNAVRITLCEDYNTTMDDLYFMSMFAMNGTHHTTYLNSNWFNVSETLLSNNIIVHRVMYSQCLSELQSMVASYYFYGIFPCDIATISPTDSPTNDPTSSPSHAPTIPPSDSPTDTPTSSPSGMDYTYSTSTITRYDSGEGSSIEDKVNKQESMGLLNDTGFVILLILLVLILLVGVVLIAQKCRIGVPYVIPPPSAPTLEEQKPIKQDLENTLGNKMNGELALSEVQLR